MTTGTSIRFFDEQFRRQIESGERQLNPFEQTALPFLHGHVLDYGCGLGNLSLAAAGQGCSALALDASPAAIESLRAMALQHGLPIEADLADLRVHALPARAFDCVVAIGLLMFFGCADARLQLAGLQAAVRPGGIAVINVLVEGTTYLDMFDPLQHCLFGADDLQQAFAGWTLLHAAVQDFEAPRGLCKRFATVIARKAQG